jgi:hypothetical protein
MTGNGYIAADWSLAALALVASSVSYYSASNCARSRIFRAASVAVAFGWSLFAVRLFAELAIGGDPTVHPVSLVALSLVAGGTIVRRLMHIVSVCRKDPP